MIIDFHTHIFPEKIASKTLDILSKKANIPYYTDGTAAGLYSSMRSSAPSSRSELSVSSTPSNPLGLSVLSAPSNSLELSVYSNKQSEIQSEIIIDISINLPAVTSPDKVYKVNEDLLKNAESFKQKGILSFAGIHPDFDNYREELRLRSEQGFKGVKIHPAYQGRDVDDPKFLRIIDYANSLGLVVIAHGGIDIGLPEHNYADVDMVLNVIKEVHPDKFVLAHMGGWDDWDNVEKYLSGSPVYFDTSFSIAELQRSLEADVNVPGLSKENFYRLCEKHGTDKILFGTDSPWAGQTEYVKAIMDMPFTAEERAAIFGGNARRLLGLPSDFPKTPFTDSH